MGFSECINSAVAGGDLTKEEGSALQDEFQSRFAQNKLNMPDGKASQAAKESLAQQLRIEAADARKRLKMQKAVQGDVIGYFRSYTNAHGKADIFEAALNLLEHYGLGGVQTLQGKAKAIISLAHGEMADAMTAYRRSWATGRRFNKPSAENVVREMMGEATGDASAKALGDSATGVLNKMVKRYQDAGGTLGHLENYFPQLHDAAAMLKAGRDNWIKFTTDLLDRAKMIDPLTKAPMTDARLAQTLQHAWASIATDGASNIKPTMTRMGIGSVATQRADSRFLQFKDADSYLKYASNYGQEDPIKALFDHINGLAHDIAAMETLGPNPSAMVEWIKQAVKLEAAKSIEGKPSLYYPGNKSLEGVADQINYTGHRIDSVYSALRGRTVVSGKLAAGVSNLRNVLTSAQLGGAALTAAAGDPFVDLAARYLTNMPLTHAFTAILKTFSGGTREAAVRSGMMWDDFVHILGDSARFTGLVTGSEWSKWLVDRTMQWSFLEPMTQARKHVFGLDIQAMLGDHAGGGFDKLPPMMQTWMKGYGITPSDWEVMRAAPLFRADPSAAPFLRPIDIAKTDAGGPVAEKLLQLIYGQTERAVPSGTVRSQTLMTMGTTRGTLPGELMNSFLQYKSFGLSIMGLQLQALQQLWHVQGKGSALAYGTGMLSLLTLGGAIAMQLRHVSQGRDMQDMKDPKFWMAAAQTGGGLGILGDFLFQDQSRFGHGFMDTLAGPLAGFGQDTYNLTAGNAIQVMRNATRRPGQKAGAVDFGGDLANYAGRYTPGMSLWYGRLAVRRLLLDQLQYATDSDAHTKWRRQQKQLKSDTGQGFWWKQGDLAPSRRPAYAGN